MSSNTANDDTGRAWAYHNATKHSEWSLQTNRHYLDWANQPLPLKIYTTLDPIPLPRDADPTGISALSAISATDVAVEGEKIPTLADLVRILYFSAGITKKKTYPGGEIYFRAASCTGALYEFELYLVCADLPGLTAGLYHFGPGDFALRLLRAGDFRGVLVDASAREESVTSAPVTIVCTGTYWRNAWKYQARAYRHFGWDDGTILANLLAAATALNLPARVVMGFVDEDVNRLLGLGADREVAFSMVSLGRTSGPAPEPPAEIERLKLETEPLSTSEVDYPAMREMHAASSFLDVDEVRRWRGAMHEVKKPEPHGRLIRLEPFGEDEMAPEGIGTVILKRGSTRRFDRSSSLSFQEFSTLLCCSTREIPADFL